MSIVKVVKNNYTAEPLYQWSVNQVLRVYGLSLARVPEVHFTNQAMSRAIVRQATMDAAGVITVDVPNSLLQTPYTITAYICGYDGLTFETYHKLKLPIKTRPKPTNYTLINDQEVYSFNALENAVQNALTLLDTATSDMKNAENTLKETTANIGTTVNASVQAALPGFLDATLTDPNKAAQAAAVAAAIAAGINTRARVVLGTYTGTGVYGADNPNVIELGFKPQLVIINKSFSTDSGANSTGANVRNGLSLFYGNGENQSYAYVGTSARWVENAWTATVTETGISWYYTLDTVDGYDTKRTEAVQLNYSGVEYTYIAIG